MNGTLDNLTAHPTPQRRTVDQMLLSGGRSLPAETMTPTHDRRLLVVLELINENIRRQVIGDALHHKGIIFGASDNRRAAAIYFGRSENRGAEAAAVGAPACTDLSVCMGMSENLLASGQFAEAQNTWDRILELGGSLEFLVCRERAVAGCNAGTFSMNAKEVSFVDGKGQSVFAAPLLEVESKGAQRELRDTPQFASGPLHDSS